MKSLLVLLGLTFVTVPSFAQLDVKADPAQKLLFECTAAFNIDAYYGGDRDQDNSFSVFPVPFTAKFLFINEQGTIQVDSADGEPFEESINFFVTLPGETTPIHYTYLYNLKESYQATASDDPSQKLTPWTFVETAEAAEDVQEAIAHDAYLADKMFIPRTAALYKAWSTQVTNVKALDAKKDAKKIQGTIANLADTQKQILASLKAQEAEVKACVELKNDTITAAVVSKAATLEKMQMTVSALKVPVFKAGKVL